MRAYQVTSHGRPPDFVDLSDPAPRAGQVLVEIAACGINFADLLIAAGTYQNRPPLPATLGMEVAGTVTALGRGVTNVSPGDRVAVYAGHGGLAERGVFAASDAICLPAGMPFDVAAGFPIAYGTSHLALTRRARLCEGETLLVLGAAGGVGLTAVEIGRILGARVIAVARGPDKLAAAGKAGADHLIDSDAGDLRARVKALGGADVVYDPVGGTLMEEALRCVRPEARALSIGFASGDVPALRANHLLVKNTTMIGFSLSGYREFAPGCIAASLRTLLEWYAAGRLSPHVSHRVPFAAAPDALELVRNRRSTGKVVVEM